MKTIRQLNLSTAQLLTCDEQDAIVAGSTRTEVGRYGYCYCSWNGNHSHKETIIYEITPDTMDYVGGFGEIVGGLSLIGSGAAMAAGSSGLASVPGYVVAAGGVATCLDGIDRMMTTYETVEITHTARFEARTDDKGNEYYVVVGHD
jgi:hypothetical protein